MSLTRSLDKFVEKRQKRLIKEQVRRALKAGKLIKQPCEVCGTTENIHAHHEDYSKPLDVRWLCASHHAGLHMAETIRRNTRQGPQVCDICHELTEDKESLKTPPGVRLMCPRCDDEWRDSYLNYGWAESEVAP